MKKSKHGKDRGHKDGARAGKRQEGGKKMIKQEMVDALNHQINEELFSAYLYASMVGYFEDINLKGYANWMRIQTQEELMHAQKFSDYIIERGGRLALKAIAEPQAEWDSALAVFEAAYKHECHISECINKLSSLAIKLDDHASRVFLEWFVTEQVEEEAHADEMVQQLKLAQDSPGALFMLDREAGARSMPAPGAAE